VNRPSAQIGNRKSIPERSLILGEGAGQDKAVRTQMIDCLPGNAVPLNGGGPTANREIGVPGGGHGKNLLPVAGG